MKTNNWTYGLVFLGMTGCSMETGDSDPQESAQAYVEPLEGITVATVETPTGKVIFHQVTHDAEEPLVLVAEMGLLDVPQTPLQDLLDREELTALEVYKAITDQEPPEVLVRSHGREVLDLGRPDATVLKRFVDLNAPVKKYSATGCDEVMFGDTDQVTHKEKQRWNNVVHSDMERAPLTTPLPPDWADKRYLRLPTMYHQTKDVRFGICNDRDVTIRHTYQVTVGTNYAPNTGNYKWYPPTYGTDLPGYMWLRYNRFYRYTRTCSYTPQNAMHCVRDPSHITFNITHYVTDVYDGYWTFEERDLKFDARLSEIWGLGQ